MFEYLDAITVNGKDIYEGTETAKEYPEFAINRGLAQNLDTVMFAAEMNKHPSIRGRMHFSYLLHAVKKKKRYAKWAKKTDEKLVALEAVKKQYGYSTEKALVALQILTKDQVNQIVNKQDGGVRNGKKSS